MVTNIQINTVDASAVVYFEDGSSEVVDPQSQQAIQLVEGGFCTISEVSDDEPHPDQSLPEKPGANFIQKMREYWNKLWDQIGGELGKPEVKPHK